MSDPAGREPSPETVERERQALWQMLCYDVPPHIDRDAALWGAATVLLLMRESPPAREMASPEGDEPPT